MWGGRKVRLGVLIALCLVLAGLLTSGWVSEQWLHWRGRPDITAALACWPWPGVVVAHPHAGVTRWSATSADGTAVQLLDFDFTANPALRVELYDRDEDDDHPGDDQVDCGSYGVGHATGHLNAVGRGQVVAAWNGLFFNIASMRRTSQNLFTYGAHVAPVVLHGVTRYNVGLVRWAVGVKQGAHGPAFDVLFKPTPEALAAHFAFAAEGAQCLVHDGRPLMLAPFPKADETAYPPSRCDSPAEAGYVHMVDHLRTSRTSMGWSRDNTHFYLLIAKDPGYEAESIYAVAHRLPHAGGGWTVPDLQRFWRQFGAWDAVNVDGGDMTQLTTLRPDGQYDLVPPRIAGYDMHAVLPADCAGAPGGGSIMYFFVRDLTGTSNPPRRVPSHPSPVLQ